MRSLNLDLDRRYFQNYVINGNLRFWQRGTSITRTQAANSGGYLADRFVSAVSTGAPKSITLDRSTDLPVLSRPALYSYQITNNTIVASFAAGEFIEPMRQLFEGQITKHLNSGYITFGFWMFTSFSGVVPISVRNGLVTSSYLTTVNAIAGWNYYAVEIDLSSIIIPDTSEAGFSISVGAAAGTNLQAPSLNTWVAGNFISHSTATNWVASAGLKFRFAQLQVREGRIAPAEMRGSFTEFGSDIGNELMACQRYYEKSYDLDVTPGVAGNGSHLTISSGGNSIRASMYFKAIKRTVPIPAFYNPVTGALGSWRGENGSNPAVSSGGVGVSNISATGTDTANNNIAGHWTADAEF